MQIKPTVAVPANSESCARPSLSSSFVWIMTAGLKTLVVLTLLLGAVANLYIWATLQPVMNRLGPVIHNVDHVVDRANVVFYIFYQLGCNSSQLIPPVLCAQLETGIH
jgi:hypothetical protein